MAKRPITPTLSEREQGLAETLVEGESRRSRSDEETLSCGTMVGRYVVLEMLGCGGMGIVYTAYDPDLDRKIALKLLLPGHSRGTSARLRLQREAQAIAKLSHPHVVAVHDVGAVDDQIFIAMEFVDGMDLGRWLDAQERSPDEILECFCQAGTGLAAAHAAGLVHRDFKPENVLVGNDGRARVVDFGLVRHDEESIRQDPDDPALVEISQRHSSISERERLTEAGSVMGTPAYMSPEQFANQPGDPRSDQFSFCVSLYEGLYGEHPFECTSILELSYSITAGEVRKPPAQHRVPGRLRRVLLRGLDPDPHARYPDMEALLVALRKAGAPRKRGWIGLGVVLLGGAVTAAVWAHGAEQTSPCASVGERAQVLWNPGRKQALERAFRATERPFAADTWVRVGSRLDAHIERWTAIQREVCEEHAGIDVAIEAKDPRQRCLDDSLGETADLLAVLDDIDAGSIVHATQLVDTLASVERCTRLDAIDVHPRPTDPALQKQVMAIRSELRRWRLKTQGETDPDPSLDTLVERGNALDYDPLTAELLLAQAEQAEQRGELDRSVELHNRSFEVALASHHDLLAFEASRGLIFVHGVYRRESDEGLRWASRARAMYLRLGDDPVRRANVLSGKASVYALCGDAARAQAIYDELLPLVRRLEEPALLAKVINNIGSFYAEQRQLVLAQSYMEEAAGLQEDLEGPDHPATLRSRANLGMIAVLDDRNDEGLEKLEAVLPRQEAVLGTTSVEVSNTLDAMATALQHLEQYERALALRRRVVELREDIHGPRARPTLSARINLAATLLELDDRPAARALMQEVVPVLESQDDADLRLVIRARSVLARATWPEQPEAALELAHQALAEAADDPQSKQSIEVLERWLREVGEPDGPQGHEPSGASG